MLVITLPLAKQTLVTPKINMIMLVILGITDNSGKKVLQFIHDAIQSVMRSPSLAELFIFVLINDCFVLQRGKQLDTVSESLTLTLHSKTLT